MSAVFDTDPIGSILLYAVLAQRPTAREERSRWIRENLRHSSVEFLEPFGGPDGTLTRTHLINMLQHGRDARAVRTRVTQVFGLLETNYLFAPFGADANMDTTYRVVTELGRELWDSDSYQEFLYGSLRIVERWKGSVLRVANPNGSGIGTGFIVNDHMVATSRHVLDDLPAFYIETADGKRLSHGEVQRHPDINVDLALIQLTESTDLRVFKIASGYDLLDQVVVFGYPPIPRSDDAYLVVHRGEISAAPRLYSDGQRVIIVSCLLRGGNSGGPVVNNRGQVIGVVSQQLFRQVAPTEATLNEGLGLAAATEAHRLTEINFA